MNAKIQNAIKNSHNYLDNHRKLKTFLEYLITALGTLISASLCAFGFKAFLSPDVANATVIVSGGTSGIARSISEIFIMIQDNEESLYLVYSISYFILNIPIIYISIRYVSVRFGVFTAINVAIVSLLTNFAKLDFVDDLAEKVACIIPVEGNFIQAGLLTRSIIAATFAGISTCIAYAVGSSAGGADAISYYFSLRKSTNVGKYFVIINGAVIVLFSVVHFIRLWVGNAGFDPTYISECFIILVFASIYLFVCALVIDAINRRNKKEQLQIITKDENLSKIILSKIPHGATILKGKGAFTGEERFIIYVIVSIHETKSVVDIIKSADPNSFINITTIKQVYGRFFIKPIK